MDQHCDPGCTLVFIETCLYAETNWWLWEIHIRWCHSCWSDSIDLIDLTDLTSRAMIPPTTRAHGHWLLEPSEVAIQKWPEMAPCSAESLLIHQHVCILPVTAISFDAQFQRAPTQSHNAIAFSLSLSLPLPPLFRSLRSHGRNSCNCTLFHKMCQKKKKI